MVKMVTFLLYILYKNFLKRKKIWALADFGICAEMSISIITTIGFYLGVDPRY